MSYYSHHVFFCCNQRQNGEREEAGRRGERRLRIEARGAPVGPQVLGRVVAPLGLHLAQGRDADLPGGQLRHRRGRSVGAGILDALAAAAFIVAAHTGQLSVVAIVSNLYPAVTVLFAHFQLHERLERHQIAGMLGACASVALLTLA